MIAQKLMIVVALALAPQVTSAADNQAQGIPKEYRLLFQEDFSTTNAARRFVMTDGRAWNVAGSNSGTLELKSQSKYQPPFRSPVNIALISSNAFGDFILDVDLKQTGKEYGHRDMCLFFGMQDAAHFYYAHLATAADDHAHNVFIVDGAPRTKIARETTKGVNWGLDVWHKVRLERRVSDGTIKVYFDDLTKPLMIAEDKKFGAGHIGFGSFDDTGMIDNIQIWGTEATSKAAPSFPSAATQ